MISLEAVIRRPQILARAHASLRATDALARNLSMLDVPCSQRMFGPQAHLYRQGDVQLDYYLLRDGWLALRVVLESGSHHIVDLALPGSFLGLLPKSTSGFGHSAVCLTAVAVSIYARSTVDRLLATDSVLSHYLMQVTAAHEARAHDHLVNISGRGARERVAHLLLELFYRVQGKLPQARGDQACIPLTLEQIGEATGLTGVHVNRMLRLLREQGVLTFLRQHLQVLDPVGFLAAAGWDGIAGDPAERWPLEAWPPPVASPA